MQHSQSAANGVTIASIDAPHISLDQRFVGSSIATGVIMVPFCSGVADQLTLHRYKLMNQSKLICLAGLADPHLMVN